MNNIGKSLKKESAPRQQGLLYLPHDIVAELRPAAQAMGIGIAISPSNEIRISRWNYSRTFQSGKDALAFLHEMGVTA